MAAVEDVVRRRPDDVLTAATAAEQYPDGLVAATISNWAKAGTIQGAEVRPDGLAKPKYHFTRQAYEDALKNRSQASIALQERRKTRPEWGRGARSNGRKLRSVPKPLPMPEKADGLLTRDEAAKILNCSTRKITDLVTKKALAPVMTVPPYGSHLYSRADIERLLDSESEQPASEASIRLQPNFVSVEDAFTTLEVAVRELKYALRRERQDQAKKDESKQREVIRRVQEVLQQ